MNLRVVQEGFRGDGDAGACQRHVVRCSSRRRRCRYRHHCPHSSPPSLSFSCSCRAWTTRHVKKLVSIYL